MTVTSVFDAPAEFICPISLQVMKDPVMSRSGQNYERKSIVEWLKRGNGSCPITRQPLKPSSLVPNSNLKGRIKNWRETAASGSSTFEEDPSQRSLDVDDDELEEQQRQQRFVGVLDVNGNMSSSKSHEEEEEQDELLYLLELYNEVLEIAGPAADYDNDTIRGTTYSSSSSR